jgi:ABC-type transporter Mla subunit MlaD
MSKRRFGDWAIAGVVVACSAVLFAALAFALGGNPFSRPSRTLRVNLPDATGIGPSSQVKYAGAVAGSVATVRMLTPRERIDSGDPANAVELTLALNPGVPELSQGLHAAISSDTILSDKFILLIGGDPAAPALADAAVIPGTPPTTIDELSSKLDLALDSLRGVTGGGAEGALSRIGKLIDEANAAVAEARALVGSANGFIGEGSALVKNGDSLVGDARALVANGRSLLDENREPLRDLIAKLSKTADSLDDLAARADKVVRDNEAALGATLDDARAAVENLKIAATYARLVLRSLAKRPQQLLWGPGRQPTELPAEQQILDSQAPVAPGN